jgi:hypothetical protein
MNVHLVTIVGGCIDVLPHMLGHYHDLGIESFFVHVQIPFSNDPLVEQAKEITRAFGFNIASVSVGEWLHNSNRELYWRTQQSSPDDWFLIADQDELQAYPRDLASILYDCDRDGYEYIEGCFLDRFARDGSFPAISASESIWQQFPLAGFVSAPLLQANPNKIVASKGRVGLSSGQHFALSGCGCPPKELYIPVHHFKWIAGILDRLEQRAKFRRERGDRYWEESQRFVDYCRTHNGRMNVADAAFYLAEAVPEYPNWERVKQLSMDLASELR